LTPCTVKKTFEHVAAVGAHLIAQVKANQPTLHQRIAEICQSAAPVDRVRTTDQKRRSRDEIRLVEVFDPGAACAACAACLDAAAEWADHVTAIVRVSRDTLTRITTTGLWEGTSQVAYFIADIALPATVCAKPSAVIGGLRTGCIMSGMSASVRTTAGSAAIPASSLACDPSPPTFYASTAYKT
jgi:hypothetical protein